MQFTWNQISENERFCCCYFFSDCLQLYGLFCIVYWMVLRICLLTWNKLNEKLFNALLHSIREINLTFNSLSIFTSSVLMWDEKLNTLRYGNTILFILAKMKQQKPFFFFVYSVTVVAWNFFLSWNTDRLFEYPLRVTYATIIQCIKLARPAYLFIAAKYHDVSVFSSFFSFVYLINKY